MNTNFDIDTVKNASRAEAIAAIDKHFIILNDKNIAVLEDGKYVIHDPVTVNRVYIKRLPEPLQKYFHTEKTDIRRITYELNKPVLFDNYLNLCPPTLHQYQPYESFPESTKQSVELMLNHIKEVLSSNKIESYNYVMKWFANMAKGGKNNAVLYLKGPQGTGKSTPIDFIKQYVIGLPLSLETGSGPLRNRFNSELEGKLLVVFEELENFGASEWTSISSTLKRWITALIYTIEGKGEKVKQVANINNYILISNNDAIKDDNGRRYFILDILTKYIGNKQYFDMLYKRCFNMEVGHAFYCYLLEIDTTDFNPQDFPTTQSKADSHAKRLPSEYVFLKEQFIRHKEGIAKTSPKDLFAQYKVRYQDAKTKGQHEFYRSLRDVGISPIKSNGYNYYNVSYDALLEIATRFHWIHEYDEIDVPEQLTEEEPSVLDDKDTKIDELMKQNNALMAEIQQLKEQLRLSTITPSILPPQPKDIKVEADTLKQVPTPPTKTKKTAKKVIVPDDEDDNSTALDLFDSL